MLNKGLYKNEQGLDDNSGYMHCEKSKKYLPKATSLAKYKS